MPELWPLAALGALKRRGARSCYGGAWLRQMCSVLRLGWHAHLSSFCICSCSWPIPPCPVHPFSQYFFLLR